MRHFAAPKHGSLTSGVVRVQLLAERVRTGLGSQRQVTGVMVRSGGVMLAIDFSRLLSRSLCSGSVCLHFVSR